MALNYTTMIVTATLLTEAIDISEDMRMTNVDNTTEILETGYSSKERALRGIYAIIGCLGILGNSLVCVVFLSRRQAFSSVTNMLILNQSIIDLLDSIVFLILRFGPRHMPSNAFGEILCRFWYNEYVLWSLFICSTVNLVFVSLERYFAICHPVKHRSMLRPSLPKYVIGFIWMTGFVYQIYWVAVQVFDNGDCYPNWRSTGVQRFMGLILFSCEYLLPLTIMTFSYMNIIMMLRRRTAGDRKKQVSIFQRAKKNVTITLCLVFVSYVVCWTPTECTYILYNMGYHYDFSSTTHDVIVVLVLCNMIVNPFIYGFKYEHFQQQFKRLFCSCCETNRIGDTNLANVTVDPAGVESDSNKAPPTTTASVASPDLPQQQTEP